jgi:hypothetical protein
MREKGGGIEKGRGRCGQRGERREERRERREDRWSHQGVSH